MKVTLLSSVVLIAAWLLSLWINPPAFNTKAYVHEVFYLTGALAWLWMALCLVIAARPKWIERVFGAPVDRLYILHKGLGYAVIVMAFLHYWTKTFFIPVLQFFWTLPKGPKKVPMVDPTFWEQVWGFSRTFAKISSEWIIWIMLLLALLCLVKKLPYKKWIKIHSLFAVAFIVLAIHALRLLEMSDYLNPFGWLVVLISAVGLWASVMILCKGPGWQKRKSGTVVSVSQSGAVAQLEISTELAREVKAGQFVFLKIKGDEAHPFSVADFHDGKIVLWIKQVGDFTNSLAQRLKAGDPVEVEGPWGTFLADFKMSPQVWCATGIGIAPFYAWLKAAATGRGDCLVKLFWTVPAAANAPFGNLVRDRAEKAGVNLVVWDKTRPRLEAKTLMQDHPKVAAFCGAPKLIKQFEDLADGKPLIRHEKFGWR